MMDKVREYESRRKTIKYGDRLFARIIMRGRTVVEFMVNQVNDMSELLGELRKKVKGMQGLAQVYIRNYSRGWSLDQPLMLYAGSSSSRGATSSYSSGATVSSSSRMLFPWETH